MLPLVPLLAALPAGEVEGTVVLGAVLPGVVDGVVVLGAVLRLVPLLGAMSAGVVEGGPCRVGMLGVVGSDFVGPPPWPVPVLAVPRPLEEVPTEVFAGGLAGVEVAGEEGTGVLGRCTDPGAVEEVVDRGAVRWQYSSMVSPFARAAAARREKAGELVFVPVVALDSLFEC